ncbi:putative ATPase [Stella humosa]|uniref:Putative ATPase n=1 Tax=Stella humosa TaxID=94 RepID=A0A3N1KR68_9PROT|nr:winged helix-turn-helix domain-containing protein [Stella humosa]ROP80830.1 putative ATPase [Stella humosa]BBK33378.1 ATPase [Stella humosa]
MESRSRGVEDRAYRFGEYRLLPARQLLLHGDDPVRIGSRAFDLLRLLVERQGELLSKAELIRFAWPDTFVHGDNLKVNIAALRRALAQAGTDVPFIATIPGRGYRFVATVQVEGATTPDDAPARFPAPGDGLPGPSSVIGREDDIAQIADALDGRRFLTIVGPAGVGKTTTAVAAARRAAECYPDGICFIDLAAIGDPQLVAAAVACGIGLGDNPKDILVGIVNALRGRRKLLIFDNCEHVLTAASVVAEHIRAAVPDIAILATSREPLRTRNETLHRLPPLPCPAKDDGIDRERAMTFPAVALFAARAGEAAGFRMSDADAPVVASICRRLDGIPLAIELAAPRLLSCDAATLLGLLERNFELLSYGPPHAPIRQQTLLATLDWSYRLLSDDEAAMLRLLAVFAGTFTLEDAVGVGRHLEHSPDAVAGWIEGLAGKSLLSSGFAEGGLQYRLLDATRSYAAERLRGAREHRHASAAHAAWLLGLFEQAEVEWQWRIREEWTAAYGRRANDLRKAIDWAFGEDGDARLGIGLTAAAIPLWDELSSVEESGRHVRRTLRSPALAECAPALQMRLATAHAWSLTYTERFDPEAEAAWQESLRLAELTGDADYRLRALWGLAILQCYCGRHRQALASLRQFEALAEREDDRSAAPAGERLRVITEFYLGDVRGAHEELKRLVRRHDTHARRSRVARFQIDSYVGIKTSLSLAEWVCGLPEQAVVTAQAALDAATTIGHVVSQSNVLVLAVLPIDLWTGRIAAAERHLTALAANLDQPDIALWGPAARFFEGMIRHERGDAGGLDQVRTVLAELAAANLLVRLPNCFAMLAAAALQHDRMDIARESIAAALDHLERQEEFWCQPEVLRVRGLVQWRDGDTEEAERTLLRAAQLAGESGAYSFELRAALSLAECWTAGGRPAAALALLDPICRRFDEAGESRDIVQARQLLARLHMPAGQARTPAASRGRDEISEARRPRRRRGHPTPAS